MFKQSLEDYEILCYLLPNDVDLKALKDRVEHLYQSLQESQGSTSSFKAKLSFVKKAPMIVRQDKSTLVPTSLLSALPKEQDELTNDDDSDIIFDDEDETNIDIPDNSNLDGSFDEKDFSGRSMRRSSSKRRLTEEKERRVANHPKRASVGRRASGKPVARLSLTPTESNWILSERDTFIKPTVTRSGSARLVRRSSTAAAAEEDFYASISRLSFRAPSVDEDDTSNNSPVTSRLSWRGGLGIETESPHPPSAPPPVPPPIPPSRVRSSSPIPDFETAAYTTIEEAL